MEIKRKAYQQLLSWKNSQSASKAILIKGAHRVGKSYLAELFSEREYKSHILIDFSSPIPGTIETFRKYGNRSQLDELFNQLSVLYSTPLYPHHSVIVFDEVQKYPKARELIKHLVADGRYDYIETGSLISIKKNVRDILIPSEEAEINLYPLDFEEFLNACDDFTSVPFLLQHYQNSEPLGNLLSTINEKLRTYMIIGGMPQAVAAYIATRNINDVERVKRDIIRLYREDIGKYAEGYVAEASAIFDAIPSQLSHHDKKVKYASLGAGKRYSNYSDALHWIEESMVGSLSYGVDSPEHFQDFKIQPDAVKCYMSDTGLLLTLSAGKNYLSSELYKSFTLGKLAVNKGMMTENLIAQILLSRGFPLRFFETRITDRNTGKTSKYEVDFLIQKNGETTPIEVKSGYAGAHSSLDYFREKYKSSVAHPVVLTKGDLRTSDGCLYLPLAMAIFL